jgi:hypothetical protein
VNYKDQDSLPPSFSKKQFGKSFGNEGQAFRTKGMSHCGLCHLHYKSILRQKKNYGNSNISPCKNIIIFLKNPLKETKILQEIIIIITLL